MALNAWVDSFLPQSEKCGNERAELAENLIIIIMMMMFVYYCLTKGKQCTELRPGLRIVYNASEPKYFEFRSWCDNNVNVSR